MKQFQTFRSETAFHFIALVIGVEYVQLMSIADTFRYIRKVFNTARHVRQYNTMEQTRTAFQSHINDMAVEQPVPATVTEYFIQILDIICIVLSVARNNYIKISSIISGDDGMCADSAAFHCIGNGASKYHKAFQK